MADVHLLSRALWPSTLCLIICMIHQSTLQRLRDHWKLTCSLLTSTLRALEVLPHNAFDKSTYLLTYLITSDLCHNEHCNFPPPKKNNRFLLTHLAKPIRRSSENRLWSWRRLANDELGSWTQAEIMSSESSAICRNDASNLRTSTAMSPLLTRRPETNKKQDHNIPSNVNFRNYPTHNLICNKRRQWLIQHILKGVCERWNTTKCLIWYTTAGRGIFWSFRPKIKSGTQTHTHTGFYQVARKWNTSPRNQVEPRNFPLPTTSQHHSLTRILPRNHRNIRKNTPTQRLPTCLPHGLVR